VALVKGIHHLHLNSLSVQGLRNLKSQLLHFPDRVSLIVGENGQGKTSILEAIFILSHARSFRVSQLRDVCTWTKESSRSSELDVVGEVSTGDGDKKIRCFYKNGHRQVYLNDNRVDAASQFYGQLCCVVFTPDELQIVKGAPALRRKFLDRMLAMIDPQYVDNLVSYQRALRSRNSILQAAQRLSEVEKELLPWDELLVRYGTALSRARSDLCKGLHQKFIKYYEQITSELSLSSNGEVSDSSEGDAHMRSEKVSFELDSAFVDKKNGPIDALALLERYRQRHADDVRRRATGEGVQKDDILFRLDTGSGDRDARKSVSQGQARSIALALKLAATEYLIQEKGESPILLLDDVESELDEKRRRALYKLISAFESQVIVTATEETSQTKSHLGSCSVYRVKEGFVSLAKDCL
jgi:DNA replication and repair protein RecF